MCTEAKRSRMCVSDAKSRVIEYFPKTLHAQVSNRATGHYSSNCPAKSTQVECRTCGAKAHFSGACLSRNSVHDPSPSPSSHSPMAEQVSRQSSVISRHGKKTDSSYRLSTQDDYQQQQPAPLGSLESLSLGVDNRGETKSSSLFVAGEHTADLLDLGAGARGSRRNGGARTDGRLSPWRDVSSSKSVSMQLMS